MGINIGLDIGAISLKLAALGKPEDRAALESVCAAKPSFRFMEWDAPGGTRFPLVLSQYQRISGSPSNRLSICCRNSTTSSPRPRSKGCA